MESSATTETDILTTTYQKKFLDYFPEWTRSFLKNPKALAGIVILIFFILVALFANQIAPVDPLLGPNKIVGLPKQPPSSEHWLGTTMNGQDVFTQIVHGSRRTLSTAFITAIIIVIIATLIGITAGFVGGMVDETLSLFTNVFLIIPALPLMIVIAGWLESSSQIAIIAVLAFTGWAFGARVMRSQALAVRNSEYIEAARVAGESTGHIVTREILPNMYSLVVSFFISAATFVILTQASLEFLGLGNPTAVTWGTILYWAQNSQALLQGAWWVFVPAGLCIALVSLAMTLINYGFDELTNPNLKQD
jgi:peptide/nickel transport system permease protein